jgi:hypothetical protein
MNVPGVFERITAALDQASIAYMLPGSFASAHQGSICSGMTNSEVVREKAIFQQLSALEVSGRVEYDGSVWFHVKNEWPEI